MVLYVQGGHDRTVTPGTRIVQDVQSVRLLSPRPLLCLATVRMDDSAPTTSTAAAQRASHPRTRASPAAISHLDLACDLDLAPISPARSGVVATADVAAAEHALQHLLLLRAGWGEVSRVRAVSRGVR